ncbi:hypothetical protein [Burkholderia cepacia]|uniref:hypothetical protein n=1 Tax=Burkholderia cepacia TaxID=292 RepID=UPI001FC8C962|nr:hypothetical protein [Burkholderia cepacia]
MSNGVVVRDRGIAILAIDRWKCILVERASIAGAELVRIDGALPNNAGDLFAACEQ